MSAATFLAVPFAFVRRETARNFDVPHDHANNFDLGSGFLPAGSAHFGMLPASVTLAMIGPTLSAFVPSGVVRSWGSNSYGQLGNGTTTDSHVPVEVSSNGSFLSDIVQVTASQYSSYALSYDGSLYAWGDNACGELGLGVTTSKYTTPSTSCRLAASIISPSTVKRAATMSLRSWAVPPYLSPPLGWPAR